MLSDLKTGIVNSLRVAVSDLGE